jgi:hypothetical protein
VRCWGVASASFASQGAYTVFAKINVPKNGKPKNSEFLISEARGSREKNAIYFLFISTGPLFFTDHKRG